MNRMLRGALPLLASVMIGIVPAYAQIDYGGGRDVFQSAGPTLTFVDFTFDGAGSPEISFEFSEPVFGISYSRPGFALHIARGVQSESDRDDLTLLDASILGYGAFRPFDAGPGGFELFIPVSLASGYRKVTRDGDDLVIEAFEFTSLSIGGGLGFVRSKRMTSLIVRALPYYGITTRSVGDDTGTTVIFDGDIEFSVGPFGDRYGVSFGYGFRWQRWNLDASRFFQGISQETFDYTGTMNTIRIGLLF